MNERFPVHLRLAPDFLKRVDKVARAEGLTRQAFIEAAVLARLMQKEEQVETFKPLRTEHEPRKRIDYDQSIGLNLSAKLDAIGKQYEQAADPTPAPPQVVVQVGNQNTSGGVQLDFLAQYILAGKSEFDRDQRSRRTVRMIQETVENPEERKALAAKLDEIVSKSTPKKEDNFFQSARMTYDKVMGLLK